MSIKDLIRSVFIDRSISTDLLSSGHVAEGHYSIANTPTLHRVRLVSLYPCFGYVPPLPTPPRPVAYSTAREWEGLQLATGDSSGRRVGSILFGQAEKNGN